MVPISYLLFCVCLASLVMTIAGYIMGYAQAKENLKNYGKL
jgi:ABC-type cobalt transport system substrate-binding protein